MDRDGFCAEAGITVEVVEAWIEAGWLTPRHGGAADAFTEIDLARVRLIADLRQDLGVNDEGIGVVLDLIEQIHGLRRALRGVVASLHAQPDPVRQQLLEELERALSGPMGKVDL